MATTQKRIGEVTTDAKYQVTYEWRSALFGLLSWKAEIKADRVSGLHLHAVMSEKPETVSVYVKGEVYEYKEK